ncbi:hypothetical protein ABID23_000821 [Bartonella silvatica]|uniref:Phage integrase n=1 Tax=Bartonella silvatica TaxID=357760 RepID=A0ABV2HGP9_9HYPH
MSRNYRKRNKDGSYELILARIVATHELANQCDGARFLLYKRKDGGSMALSLYHSYSTASFKRKYELPKNNQIPLKAVMNTL